MKISQVKILLERLRKNLEYRKKTGFSHSDDIQKTQYHNLFSLIENFLLEHNEFIKQAYNYYKIKEMLSSLDYLEVILDMRVEELNEKELEKPRIFLDSAQDKLKQAGKVFDNHDYSGVSNKLNTTIELALKDALDIPSTIKGINISKIIDVLISEGIGPVDYLKEVKKHVLMDNLVKHQGMSPVESRAVTAIASVENLFKKLNEPLKINEKIKDKIWSDVK